MKDPKLPKRPQQNENKMNNSNVEMQIVTVSLRSYVYDVELAGRKDISKALLRVSAKESYCIAFALIKDWKYFNTYNSTNQSVQF